MAGVQATRGIAKTRAYELTKEIRSKRKADLRNEVVKLAKAGATQREIAKQMSLNRGTVSRWLASRNVLRDQILQVYYEGEKKTRELIKAVDGQPTAIKNELKRLVDAGEIEKVWHRVYKRGSNPPPLSRGGTPALARRLSGIPI